MFSQKTELQTARDQVCLRLLVSERSAHFFLIGSNQISSPQEQQAERLRSEREELPLVKWRHEHVLSWAQDCGASSLFSLPAGDNVRCAFLPHLALSHMFFSCVSPFVCCRRQQH